jgi:hypothetical protein
MENERVSLRIFGTNELLRDNGFAGADCLDL